MSRICIIQSSCLNHIVVNINIPCGDQMLYLLHFIPSQRCAIQFNGIQIKKKKTNSLAFQVFIDMYCDFISVTMFEINSAPNHSINVVKWLEFPVGICSNKFFFFIEIHPILLIHLIFPPFFLILFGFHHTIRIYCMHSWIASFFNVLDHIGAHLFTAICNIRKSGKLHLE